MDGIERGVVGERPVAVGDHLGNRRIRRIGHRTPGQEDVGISPVRRSAKLTSGCLTLSESTLPLVLAQIKAIRKEVSRPAGSKPLLQIEG